MTFYSKIENTWSKTGKNVLPHSNDESLALFNKLTLRSYVIANGCSLFSTRIYFSQEN